MQISALCPYYVADCPVSADSQLEVVLFDNSTDPSAPSVPAGASTHHLSESQEIVLIDSMACSEHANPAQRGPSGQRGQDVVLIDDDLQPEGLMSDVDETGVSHPSIMLLL